MENEKTPKRHIGGKNIEQAFVNLERSFARNISNSHIQIQRGNIKAAKTFYNNAKGDYFLLESTSEKGTEYADKLNILKNKLGINLTR